MFAVDTDLQITAGPVMFEWTRVFQDSARDAGILGRRWRANWESRIVAAETDAVLEEAGIVRSFKRDLSTGGFVSSDGDRITRARDGTLVLSRADGSTDLFDTSGRLVARETGNGNRIVLRYGGDGRLARIEAPFGVSVNLIYDTAGRVMRVDSNSGRSVRYAYGRERLESVQTSGLSDSIRYRYDDKDRLTRWEHPQFGVNEFAYDARDRVTSRQLSDGSRETWQYDDTTRTIRQVDALGGTTTRQVSADGRREIVTDALERRTVIEMGAHARPVQVIGSRAKGFSLKYDALGRLVATTDDQTGRTASVAYLGQTSLPTTRINPDGSRDELEYDAQRNLVRIKQNGVVATEITYSGNGLIERITERGGRETRLAYDAAGRIIGITDALGRVTRFEYDSRGNRTKVIDARNGTRLRIYDAYDRVVAETDATGGVTRFEYDRSGRLTRTIDPTGRAVRYEYHASGTRVSTIDAAGRSESHAIKGRQLTLRRPDGSSEQLAFDAAGQPSQVTDSFGRTTGLTYDAAGLLATLKTPGGLVFRFQHDERGRPRQLENGRGGRVTYVWDQNERLTAVADPTGATRRFQYDATGRMATMTDALGRETRLAYDGAGQLARVNTPGGAAALCEYDAERRIRACRDGGTRMTRFEYDAVDNLTAILWPNGRTQRNTYDAAGRRTSTTTPSGQTIRFDYDAAGRLTSKTLPGGRTVRYKYDKAGELAAVEDNIYPLQYDYDAKWRLTAVNHGILKKAVRYTYDANGRKTSVTGTSGQQIGYRYDALSRVASIKLPGGAEITISYDATDRLERVTYPNGVKGEWRYDAAGRVEKITYTMREGASAATREVALSYAYDAAANPTERRRGDVNETRQYRYDVEDRLIEERTGGDATSYAYNSGGDRVERRGRQPATFKYDDAGLLVSAGNEKIAHDANGNIVRREGPRGIVQYTFDAEGWLTKAQTPAGAMEFAYAHDGRRVLRRSASGAIARFVHDGDNLLEELNENGTLRTLFVHAPGLDRPLAMLRGSEAYFYHADALGSIQALSGTGGRIVAEYDVDAFGVVVRSTAAANSAAAENPFVYTGREYEAALGLHYLRARYYDPALGRFLSPDPLLGTLEDPRTMNRYAYALNAPTRYVDQTGLNAAAFDYGAFANAGIEAAAVDRFAAGLARLGMNPDAVRAAVALRATQLAQGAPASSVLAVMETVAPTVLPALPAATTTVVPPVPAGSTNIVSATAATAGSSAAGTAANAGTAATGGTGWSDFFMRQRGPLGDGSRNLLSTTPSKITDSMLGDAMKGAWLGTLIAVTQASFDPYKSKSDVAIEGLKGFGWGAGIGFVGEGIKQAVIKKFGESAIVAIAPRLLIGGFGVVTASTLYNLNEANKARNKFEFAVAEAIIRRMGEEQNPALTQDGIARMIAGMRNDLAVLRQIHSRFGASAGADPLAAASAKVVQLEALRNAGTGAGTQQICTSLAPAVKKLGTAATVVSGHAKHVERMFTGAGSWPQSKNTLQAGLSQLEQGTQAASAARADWQQASRALQTVAQPGAQSAVSLHGEAMNLIASARGRSTQAGGAGIGSADLNAFNGLKSALLVKARAMKSTVGQHRVVGNSWADFRDIELQTDAMKAPAATDPSTRLAQDAAALEVRANAALEAAGNRSTACEGLTASPEQLATEARNHWETIRQDAQALLRPPTQRIAALRKNIADSQTLLTQTVAQINLARQKGRESVVQQGQRLEQKLRDDIKNDQQELDFISGRVEGASRTISALGS